MSVSGFDTVEAATAATSSTATLASASLAHSQQPQSSSGTLSATVAGLQPLSSQNQRPHQAHLVSSLSSQHSNTAALLHTNTSTKKTKRRSVTSSVRSNSNEEVTTSSHSAPGSPKTEAAKRVAAASAGNSSGAVLSHSYFHTLPEEAAVLYELKTTQDPYPQHQRTVRQCCSEELNEYERLINANQILINHNGSSTNSAAGGTLLTATPAPYQLNFISGGNLVSNINSNAGIYSQNSSTTTLKQQYPTSVTVLSSTSSGATPVAASNSVVASSTSTSQSVSAGGQPNVSQAVSSSGGKIQLDNTISPAVLADVAAAGYDSDSDIEQQQQTASTRSRQKKFLKNFKQLPTEEVVLQRYSCALVSDILLQGHLYITENYFAFHSNVFGYVTRLQIPVRSVTKITKEKTAKIIPNAVGLCTEDDVKHIFASLLSRDTTFKLMTRLWKRAIREAGRITEEELLLPDPCDPPEAGELDDIINDEESSESEAEGGRKSTRRIGESRIPNVSEVSPIDRSYIVKRMSTSNGAVYYQPTVDTAIPATSANSNRGCLANSTSASGSTPSSDSTNNQNNNTQIRRRSSILSNGGGILAHLSQATILSIFVVVLLIFLLCSSMYLVFRIETLQRQVESRYIYRIPGDGPRMGQNEEGPEKLHTLESLIAEGYRIVIGG